MMTNQLKLHVNNEDKLYINHINNKDKLSNLLIIKIKNTY